MPSHYSDMGFSFNSADEHAIFLQQVFDSGKDVLSKNGTYRIVIIDEKIEFWIQIMKSGLLKRKSRIESVEFHFSSTNSNSVRFDYWIEPKEYLSGKAYVWNVYNGNDSLPVVLNMPDADLHHRLKKGNIINVQFACFSEELDLFDTKEEYYESQTSEPKFSDEFFVPSGTFNIGETPKKPTSHVMFSGCILSAEKRTNSHTLKNYYHFTVKCQEVIFDVLADTEFVMKEPKIGGVLSGSFWISGKIIS